jgi:glycosyltransferase involved in cell wall biosynthesis
VKSRLDDLKIDYIHTYLQDSKDLPNMYRALDLYIIASRVEGGPMSLLQSWACGIPVVSTRVGMVTDLAKDLETAMVCEIENVESLVRASELLINHPQIGAQLAHNALAAIHSYDWTKIAQRYYQSLYL